MPFDLEALIAPFRELPGVDIAIEGPAGVVLAGTSSEPPPGDAVTQAIEAGPLAGGRISVWGVGAEPGLTRAFLAALVGVAGQESDPPTLRRARIDDELAHGRRLQRSFVSLVGPGRSGLRSGEPLRGRARGRRRLLRSLPAATARPTR